MEYGYAKVSTREQNEERQAIVLAEFGLSQRNIYMDMKSTCCPSPP